LAIVIHRWYQQHPSELPAPPEPRQKASPEINFSSTEVAGNIGGLIRWQRLHRGCRLAVGDLVSVRRSRRRMFCCVGSGHVAEQPPPQRPAGQGDCVALTIYVTVIRTIDRVAVQATVAFSHEAPAAFELSRVRSTSPINPAGATLILVIVPESTLSTEIR
jgi:hypothetical protein